jgi:hypothetical protein
LGGRGLLERARSEATKHRGRAVVLEFPFLSLSLSLFPSKFFGLKMDQCVLAVAKFVMEACWNGFERAVEDHGALAVVYEDR